MTRSSKRGASRLNAAADGVTHSACRGRGWYSGAAVPVTRRDEQRHRRVARVERYGALTKEMVHVEV